jgi:hypothetical protein
MKVKTLVNAMQRASVAYCDRTPEGARKLNKHGVQVDCAHGIKTMQGLTEAQALAVEALPIEREVSQGIAQATNVKVVKRIAQVVASLAGVEMNTRTLSGSARTLFLAVGAIKVAGATTRDGLVFAVTGKGNEHASEGVNVTAARKLQRMGVTSPASLGTQLSVCFADGAIGPLLSIGRRGEKNCLPVLNDESVFIGLILDRIAQATDVEIENVARALAGDKGE